MSTTQHPLTDETLDRLVSYISGGTIDCSTHEGQYDSLSEDDARTIVESLWEPMTQAVQASALATPADPHHDPRSWEPLNGPVRVGDEVRQDLCNVTVIAVVGEVDEEGDPRTAEGRLIGLLSHGTWYARRIPAHTTEKDTPMTETTTPAEPLARTLLDVPDGYGAPHHDVTRVKPDDYVAQMDDDGFIRAARAHHQDKDGDWRTEDDWLVTWADRCADRPDAVTVWPAPTPPAEEVEIPTEHPAHLRDVEGWDGERFAYMALDGGGHWCGVDQDGVARVWPLRWIAAATLPDGTRARRDGTRADGEPRFVKTQEV